VKLIPFLINDARRQKESWRLSKMYDIRRHCKSFRLACTVVALALLAAGSQAARAETGNVYVLTNQNQANGGNSIMVFHRDAKGVLTQVGDPVPTGGNGNGTGQPTIVDIAPLGSQNSLVLSGDGRLLFAVNAGSNSVSVFAASGDELTLLNTVSSGGTCPVSLTIQGDLVYVLNAGIPPAPIPPTCTLPADTTQTATSGTISGFRVDARTNQLVPLARSTQNLPGGATAFPAQVSFSPDGSVLIVTEKGPTQGQVDTFVVDRGLARPGVAFPSNGTTPFGLAFGPHDVAIVSDANGPPPPAPPFGSSSLTSYQLTDEGSLTVVTPALSDTQFLACWVNVPNSGNYAYTSNTGSGSVSSYTVSSGGNLALLNVAAASINGAPIDMAFSNNSRFLYVNDGANGAIVGFRVGPDGSLTPVTSVTGVPFGSEGIAAR
jgi:6-phosphogluconolactonase